MARMDLEMKLKSLGLVKTPQNGFLLKWLLGLEVRQTGLC